MRNTNRILPAVTLFFLFITCLASAGPSCDTVYDVVNTCCPGWCAATDKGRTRTDSATAVFNSCVEAIGCKVHHEPQYTCEPCR